MLAGGATKMPMVREMIESVTGRPPLQHGNPELLVSKGAAYWAHLLEGKAVSGRSKKPDGQTEAVDVKVSTDKPIDIASYAVGVEVTRTDDPDRLGHKNAVILPAGTALGERRERTLYKTEDGMREIRIIIHRSDVDTDDLDLCTKLATVTITGLPDGGSKGDPVQVALGHDSDGIIRGEAEDVSTSTKVDIEIVHGSSGGLEV